MLDTGSRQTQTRIGWCLDTRVQDPEIAAILAEEQDRQKDYPPGALLCSACRHPISDNEQRIEVAGSHTHTCSNPHGVVYRIGCFAAAPGCGGSGPVYAEYSWFQGYRWQVGICTSCYQHIGWQFHGESPFYGLILDRLISVNE